MLQLVGNSVDTSLSRRRIDKLPHLTSGVIRSQVGVVIELVAVSQSVGHNTLDQLILSGADHENLVIGQNQTTTLSGGIVHLDNIVTIDVLNQLNRTAVSVIVTTIAQSRIGQNVHQSGSGTSNDGTNASIVDLNSLSHLHQSLHVEGTRNFVSTTRQIGQTSHQGVQSITVHGLFNGENHTSHEISNILLASQHTIHISIDSHDMLDGGDNDVLSEILLTMDSALTSTTLRHSEELVGHNLELHNIAQRDKAEVGKQAESGSQDLGQNSVDGSINDSERSPLDRGMRNPSLSSQAVTRHAGLSDNLSEEGVLELVVLLRIHLVTIEIIILDSNIKISIATVGLGKLNNFIRHRHSSILLFYMYLN